MKNILLIFCLLTISCLYSQKKESQRFSANQRLLNKLLKKNGNVFELIAPGGIVSYIWTYTNDKIEIHSLAAGQERGYNSYTLINKIDWVNQKDPMQYKLRNCQVLDGRLLIINIINKEKDNKLIEKEYSIDLDCLQSAQLTSDFYKNLSDDIKQYKIGWK